jgi:hypothetical protein
MKTKTCPVYLAPEIKEVELLVEQVLCTASTLNGGTEDFGDIKDFEW